MLRGLTLPLTLRPGSPKHMSITSKLRLARGLFANLPTPPNSFEIGRPYFCTDTNALYIGAGTNVAMQPVSATVDLSTYATTAYVDAETARAETAETLLAPLVSPAITGTPAISGELSIVGADGGSVALSVTGAPGSGRMPPVNVQEWYDINGVLLASLGHTGILTVNVLTATETSFFIGDASFYAAIFDTAGLPGTDGQVLTNVAGLPVWGADASVAAETARAEAAEASLATSSAVTAETARAEAAESVNATAISTEVTRAEAAEGVLTTAIGTETTRAEAAEALLATSSALSTETTNRISGDAATLASAKTYADADVAAEVSARNTAIGVETTRAEAAEALLASTISVVTDVTVETTRAEAAEGVLSTSISTETTNRTAGDAATLTSAKAYADADIATEVTNRNTAIGVETTNRVAAVSGEVTARNTAIAVETTRATTAEGLLASSSSLTSAIATEVTNRNTAIAVETTRATTAEGLLAPKLVPVITKTGNYTLLATDHFVIFTTTATATLNSSLSAGTAYTVKLTGSGTITLAATSGKIDNNASASFNTVMMSVDVTFDGTNWWIS
jgi:hypothetical protein